MALRITRRRVLITGVVGAGLVGLGGAFRWLSAGYDRMRGEVTLALSTKEMAIVRALVEALLPGDGDIPSGVALEVHQRIDEEIWAAPDDLQKDLKAALHAIEHSPPLFRHWGRMTSLPPDERLVVYDQLLRCDHDLLVQAAVVMRQLAYLFYFGHAKVWPHIGYDGPWIAEPKPPLSSVRYQSLLTEARRRQTPEAA